MGHKQTGLDKGINSLRNNYRGELYSMAWGDAVSILIPRIELYEPHETISDGVLHIFRQFANCGECFL
jgi:hypothetical protein